MMSLKEFNKKRISKSEKDQRNIEKSIREGTNVVSKTIDNHLVSSAFWNKDTTEILWKDLFSEIRDSWSDKYEHEIINPLIEELKKKGFEAYISMNKDLSNKKLVINHPIPEKKMSIKDKIFSMVSIGGL